MSKAADPVKRTYRTVLRSLEGINWASEAADFLLARIKKRKKNQFLVPSFIASLCSQVEAVVNDALVDHFYYRCRRNYQNYAQAFLTRPMPDKLFLVVPLISQYKFEWNKGSPDVQLLLKLFRLRNRLLHVKHPWVLATALEYEIGVSFLFDDPDRTYYYTSEEFKNLTFADLDAYATHTERFVRFFRDIRWRINGPHFKPDVWLYKIGRRERRSNGLD
jgi:hypothetical protein